MANLTRHEPRQSITLRDAMDRLFEQAFLGPAVGNGDLAAPAIDVCETTDDVVVTAAVPGLKPEQIKISATAEALEISGEVQDETERKDATYHLRERRYGSFHRLVGLPAPVNPDAAQAEFENGVLTLTLPKAEAARRKTIKVSAKKIEAKK